jgi:hypothetical protein
MPKRTKTGQNVSKPTFLGYFGPFRALKGQTGQWEIFPVSSLGCDRDVKRESSTFLLRSKIVKCET